jgi:hypothetical protein
MEPLILSKKAREKWDRACKLEARYGLGKGWPPSMTQAEMDAFDKEEALRKKKAPVHQYKVPVKPLSLAPDVRTLVKAIKQLKKKIKALEWSLYHAD